MNFSEFEEHSMNSFDYNLIGAVNIILGIGGLSLNGYLIGIYYRKNKEDFLAILLFVTNIFLCLTYPVSVYASFKHLWPFDVESCQINGFLCLLFGYAIMMSTFLLACDDFLLKRIGNSYEAQKSIVQRNMIMFVVLNSLFWSLCPLFGWSTIHLEAPLTSCSVVYFPKSGYSSYILMSFVCSYALPVIGLACFLLKRGTVRNRAQMDLQLIYSYRKIILLMIGFLVCWTPYSIIYLWPIFTSMKLSTLFIAWGPTMAKFSPLMTALVYVVEEKYPIVS